MRSIQERPSDTAAILLVFDTHACQNHTRLEVVAIRLGRDFEIILAARLKDRREDPIRVAKVDTFQLLVLLPELHVGALFVVAEFFFDQPGEKVEHGR